MNSALRTVMDHYRILVKYLKCKAVLRDWHGVADAANDIRELEAKYPWLREEKL